MPPAITPSTGCRRNGVSCRASPKAEQKQIERHNAEIDKRVAKPKERLEAIHRPYRENLLEAKLKELPENIRAETKEALATPKDERDAVQKFLAGKFEEQLKVTPAGSGPKP